MAVGADQVHRQSFMGFTSCLNMIFTTSCILLTMKACKVEQLLLARRSLSTASFGFAKVKKSKVFIFWLI